MTGTREDTWDMKLTAKQAIFAAEYLKDFNATQAAIRAGYSKKTAGAIGAENLKKPQIQSAIKAAMAEARSEAIMTYQEMCERLTSLARRDIAHYLDKRGRITLARGKTFAIHSVDQVLGGDGNPIIKLRLADPIKAMDQLAKLKGYNAPEKHEHKHKVLKVKDPEGWGVGEYEDPPELEDEEPFEEG